VYTGQNGSVSDIQHEIGFPIPL